MRLVALILVPLLLAFAGFVAGGLVARFVLIEDNTGFEGAATVVVSGAVGAAIGLVLALVILRR